MKMTILSKILDWLFTSRVDRRDLEDRLRVLSNQLVLVLDVLTESQRIEFAKQLRNRPGLETIDLSSVTPSAFLIMRSMEGIKVVG
jgi:hypothetical protein